jgi:carbamoyl-phosphate synthase large subunit
MGMSVQNAFDLSKIDPWFLAQVEDLVLSENSIEGQDIKSIKSEKIRELKQKGFSDNEALRNPQMLRSRI